MTQLLKKANPTASLTMNGRLANDVLFTVIPSVFACESTRQAIVDPQARLKSRGAVLVLEDHAAVAVAVAVAVDRALEHDAGAVGLRHQRVDVRDPRL